MITNITIDKVTYRISKDPTDFFKDNLLMQQKCCVALDMMKDCLDYIYELLKPFYPRVFKPELYISDSMECNAIAYHSLKILRILCRLCACGSKKKFKKCCRGNGKYD